MYYIDPRIYLFIYCCFLYWYKKKKSCRTCTPASPTWKGPTRFSWSFSCGTSVGILQESHRTPTGILQKSYRASTGISQDSYRIVLCRTSGQGAGHYPKINNHIRNNHNLKLCTFHHLFNIFTKINNNNNNNKCRQKLWTELFTNAFCRNQRQRTKKNTADSPPWTLHKLCILLKERKCYSIV